MKKIINGFKIVIICTFISKLLSFLSEIIIARYLGTTIYADAYSIINGIHSVIYPMLGVGIWSLFLPEYKKKIIKSSKDEIDVFTNKIITLFLVVSIFISLFIFFFSRTFVSFISPGFTNEAKDISSVLLKLYSPYFSFSIISSIYAAILQSNNKFLGSQIREVVSYLPTIILGPILYSKLSVYGFGIALILGGIFRLVVQLPFINKSYKFKFDFNFRDNSVKRILKKTPAVLISSSTDQVHTLIDKIMASNLTIGAVSSLNYGVKLVNAVNGIFTNSIATVLYPKMSEMIEKKEEKTLNELFTQILLIIAIAIIPCMFFGLFYSKEIVTLIYKRGNFDSNSVTLTNSVFVGYLVGIYFIGIKTLIDKFLYSLDKSELVMKINLLNIVINIFLNFVLIKFIGLSGLAYATSFSTMIYIIVALLYLNKIVKFDIKKYLYQLLMILFSNFFIIFVLFNIYKQVKLSIFVSFILTGITSLICICVFYKLIKFSFFETLLLYIKKVLTKKQ